MTNNISQPKIYSLIKTPCGRSKYTELTSRIGFLAKVRLYWFIIFAIIKDWNIPNPDHLEESSS